MPDIGLIAPFLAPIPPINIGLNAERAKDVATPGATLD